MILPGGIIGGAVPSITRTDTGSYSTTSINPITFTSRALGTAGRRHIIVTIAAARAPTGVTIAGITATQVAGVTLLTSVNSFIYIASVPTGATGDVVVTFGGTNGFCMIGVYAAYNLRSATAVDTAQPSYNVAAGPNYFVDLSADLSARGVSVATVHGISITGTPTTTGLSNAVVINGVPNYAATADHTATASETPRTMGWTLNNDATGASATFR
jgi:hypothetical protein